ncbi:MAG: DUF4810 domain-containing protein [Treponema sp.]|nr:DUF4810 domain-containing protein [Treponema sp.]
MVHFFKKAGILLSAAAIFACVSCASSQYAWYDYQENYYNYVKKADEGSEKKLVKSYKKMIKSPGGQRGLVPPGIYADYGWYLLERGKTAEAKECFLKEIEYYPESSTFISSILKRLNNEKSEN